MTNVIAEKVTERFSIYNADCVEVARGLPDKCLGYTIYSPPFSSLYTYSNSPRDMGNCLGDAQFFAHMEFLLKEILRATIPGRLMSLHCMLLPTSKERDGYIGLRDFRGDLIRACQAAGWIFHSEVTIWKDPVTAMQRTKALGLLYKTVKANASMSRQGIPDYLVTVRKPGEIEKADRVTHDPEAYPVSLWQRIASPVWMDIDPSETLQKESAREDEDEKHVCLAADSLVLTRERGYVPISDVGVGENVLTHRARWMPVRDKRCIGVKPVIKVSAQGVPGLVCTSDHRIWTRSSIGVQGGTTHPRKTASQATPGWIEARSTLASYVGLTLPPVSGPSQYSEEEWWIVGRWLGDGHWGKRGDLHISCDRRETPELVAMLGESAGFVRDTNTCSQVRIKDRSGRLREIISKCGRACHGKHLPPEALGLDSIKAESLLAGYLSADGNYVAEVDRWSASSVSKVLLLEMALVAQRARGVVASVYPGRSPGQCTIEGRTMPTRQEWILSIPPRNESAMMLDNVAWKKVRKIETAGQAEVWDLQVYEDESFVVDGCVVHNCPLQLEVIRRAVNIWTNPNDIVFSPFMGIGSEGYVSLEEGRRFVGSELKESYFKQSALNLQRAVDMKQARLF